MGLQKENTSLRDYLGGLANSLQAILDDQEGLDLIRDAIQDEVDSIMNFFDELDGEPPHPD